MSTGRAQAVRRDLGRGRHDQKGAVPVFFSQLTIWLVPMTDASSLAGFRCSMQYGGRGLQGGIGVGDVPLVRRRGTRRHLLAGELSRAILRDLPFRFEGLADPTIRDLGGSIQAYRNRSMPDFSSPVHRQPGATPGTDVLTGFVCHRQFREVRGGPTVSLLIQGTWTSAPLRGRRNPWACATFPVRS